MPKRETPATKDPVESELWEQLADPERCKAYYRKARVDALRWRLEYRTLAWAMLQALARRINELLSVPAVKTVSKPGREPRVVPQNCGAAYAAVTSLIGTYVLLGKAVLAPLPSERLVNTVLDGSAETPGEAERNDSEQKAAPEATAGDPPPANATKCNVLQQNSASTEEKGVVIEPGGGGECAGTEEEPPRKAA